MAIIGQHDASGFQLLAVLISQNRKQHLVAQLRLERIPIDIEEVCILRGATVLQYVAPPEVGSAGFVACAHVVGNYIEQQAHAAALQFAEHLMEFFFGSDLGIEVVVIGNVITVVTACTCGENW